MKEVIKKILKEETEDYQMINKGIDVVISIVKKEYPYIVGWKKNGDWEESDYFLYIDLIVDYKKVMNFYNIPLRPYYERYPNTIQKIIQNGEVFAYPTSLLDFEETGENQYNETKKIKELLDDSYELIPVDYKMNYERDSVFGNTVTTPKEIKIMHFKFV